MKFDNTYLENFGKTLVEPENFFRGRTLNGGFALPDNILIFFRAQGLTGQRAHGHGRHTLMFPLDKMVYYVDQKRIELDPGMFLYIPPYALRLQHPDSPGYRRLFVTFDTKGDQSYLPESGAYALDGCTEQLCCFLNEYSTGTMEDTAIALMKFLQKPKSIHRPLENESILPMTVVRVIRMIESRLAEVYDLKSLADVAGISESHLRTLFRRHMGISIGKFIADKKMCFARNALLNSNRSIAGIAAESGFANVYVFSAFFKRHAGISPLNYRKNHQLFKGEK